MIGKIAEQLKLNKLFRYLLIGCVATVGAGAAVGTVLDSFVAGDVSVTVSQALLIGRPDFIPDDPDWEDSSNDVQGVERQTLPGHHSQPDRYIATVSDDMTRFQASVEIDSGDMFLIALPLKNASDQNVVVKMTLVYPQYGDCDEETGDCYDCGEGDSGIPLPSSDYGGCDYGEWAYLMDTDDDGKIVIDNDSEMCYIIPDLLDNKLEIKNSDHLNIIVQQPVHEIKLYKSNNINIWAEQGYDILNENDDAETYDNSVVEGPGPEGGDGSSSNNGEWFTVEVFGSDEESQSNIDNTTQVTRTGRHTWKFYLDSDAEKRPWDTPGYEWSDNIGISIATASTTCPGFYKIEGLLEVVSY